MGFKLPPDVEAKVLALAGKLPVPAVAKKVKYGNRKVELDGHRFDSEREAKRYQVLKAMQAAGEITGLRLQVPIVCEVRGQVVCRYIADFVYVRVSDGVEVAEDAKGFRTKEYKLKKRLVLACTGIEIQEV